MRRRGDPLHRGRDRVDQLGRARIARGTLAANAFYLTLPLFYFFVFIALALATPIVFARPQGQSLGRVRSDPR